MRTRTRAALAALPLAITLALTGCDSDGGGKNDGAAGDSPSLSRDEMMVRYAQCLRKHGVDVEDPKPGEGLALSNNGGDQAKVDKAMETCREYEPPAPSDEDNAKERKEMLEFAQCMRKNGVDKFADPKEGEGIGIDAEVAEDPDFKQAEKKCGGGEGDTKSNSVPQ
ncbi:hypothetical protein ACFPH6_12210 [Streptomyces xiangluensis]|uniref:Secreted protein n=1 Tax=Streptomyces xiangluensis TaxID=2665720 RepID=A0ABV8YN06_9ACTN